MEVNVTFVSRRCRLSSVKARFIVRCAVSGSIGVCGMSDCFIMSIFN